MYCEVPKPIIMVYGSWGSLRFFEDYQSFLLAIETHHSFLVKVEWKGIKSGLSKHWKVLLVQPKKFIEV